MELLGIDIGGSGIKGAMVDSETGELRTDRERIPTPQPATPEAVADVVAQLVNHFDYRGPLGCAFPAIVQNGIVHTAANIDPSWLNTPGQALLAQWTSLPVALLNDADAAGLAEMKFGAGRDASGVTIMLTLGTGIGSALFLEGELLPNTEFGHLYMANGLISEAYASDRVRDEEGLKWKVWAARLDELLRHLDRLFSPDLYILGGGVSKKHKKFIPQLTTEVPVVPAQLRNEAGIVGAAMAALKLAQPS
ncbi:MAG: ROK family protein [Ardenticatenales bacterium]|nr:ROK family protein [Ardenticatenales bacterium]